jgi:thiamine-monophosphate kinase
MHTTTPEFDLIARYFRRPAPHAALGVGDDCALFLSTAGAAIAVSTDTLVCGRHFFSDVAPQTLGHKALAVNLSDLAAMGATPRFFTLALTLPDLDHAWLAAFSEGMFTLADAQGISLIGGDTTSGPLSITITVLGEVPLQQALKRANAVDGDDIWVSGSLGGAALALKHLQKKLALSVADFEQLAALLFTPAPRINLGLKLRGVAHAAIDISDGLVADLRHICAASNVAAELDFAAIPQPKIAQYVPVNTRNQAILSGGDDYELCFTAPLSARQHIAEIATELALPCTRIGKIVALSDTQNIAQNNGVTVHNLSASAGTKALSGFDHFATNE